MESRLLRFIYLREENMANYQIIMAQRRLNRGRLYGKHEEKSVSDAVITHVTQVTVEDTTEKADEVPVSEKRSLREIWEQECDCRISYKTFLQRLQTQKWDLQKALHTPKAS